MKKICNRNWKFSLQITGFTMSKCFFFLIDSDAEKYASKNLVKGSFDILRLDIFWYYSQFFCFFSAYDKCWWVWKFVAKTCEMLKKPTIILISSVTTFKKIWFACLFPSKSILKNHFDIVDPVFWTRVTREFFFNQTKTDLHKLQYIKPST